MNKNTFLDRIEVKSPCVQDWETMHGDDRVRFCDSCTKNVNDLSAMNAKDIRKLIVRSNGNLCVRYRKGPDGKIAVIKQKFHQITRQAGMAAGVLSASMMVSTAAYAQTNSNDAPADQAVAESTIDTNSTRGGSVSGTITDQAGAVVTFALVTVYDELGAIHQSVTTNAEGYYEINNLPEGKYKIKVDAGGFESALSSLLNLSGGFEDRQNFALSVPKLETMVEVGSGRDRLLQTVVMGVVASDYELVQSSNKMIRAAQRDDLDEVKRLIGIGKKVNVKNGYDLGNTPLHYAVENGDLEMVEALLYAGAKVTIKNAEKRTALMMIDEDASVDMVNLLLRFGAATNLVDKEKNTLLMIAAEKSEEEVIRALLINGTGINAQNKQGRTALMLAADNGNLEAVQLLLQNGADANLKDKSGKTAWSMTTAEDIRQVLTGFGASAEIE